MSELRHYAKHPITLDRTRIYSQDDIPYPYEKPRGLWVSVLGEDDWPSWCIGEEFNIARLAVSHRVTLHPGANVLHISEMAELLPFYTKFNVPSDISFYNESGKSPIDWRTVATQYDGLIIAPYQWSARYSLSFYYGWDCASGCIWNLDAIADVEPVALPALPAVAVS